MGLFFFGAQECGRDYGTRIHAWKRSPPYGGFFVACGPGCVRPGRRRPCGGPDPEASGRSVRCCRKRALVWCRRDTDATHRNSPTRTCAIRR